MLPYAPIFLCSPHPRIAADPSHENFRLHRLVSPMSCDGHCLRKDHDDIMGRLSAPKPTEPAFNASEHKLSELHEAGGINCLGAN